MQPRGGNPRGNRQPRRGGSDRGRGRGRGGPSTHSQHRGHHTSSSSFSSVPSYASLVPNTTAVSIVLKQDQPTGRQVQGIVADLLTRGDHPRGVKVRLRDGRVGRVQRIVGEAEGLRGEEAVGGVGAGLGRNGEGGGSSGRGKFQHVTDVREDGYLYDEDRAAATTGDAGWFKALEEADARYEEQSGRGVSRGDVGQDGGGISEEVVTCPVCGVFEGDERAVAHHVERHFEG